MAPPTDSRPYLAVSVAVAVVFMAACGAGPGEEVVQPPTSGQSAPTVPGRDGLQPVALPELSEMIPSVQQQIRQRYETLESRSGSATTSDRELAEAYGELGMILMAADQRAAAAVCFLNARALVSTDVRWPYYLGHLYRDEGDLEQAISSFEEARELRPDDVATLIHLGETHLDQGQADEADLAFSQALSLLPNSLAALFGLGRTALMKEEYGPAVDHLERVLELRPDAAAAHYPLGLAYRGLGQMEQAEEQIRLRANEGIFPDDPLMVAVEGLLESPQAYERRGIVALDSGDWETAARYFQAGLALDPSNAALRHRLGTTFYMRGDVRAALTTFEDVVRSEPEYAPAQYSLGLLYVESGRFAEAAERFAAALEERPTYTEARHMLANALRRAGDPGGALPHYEQVLTMDPEIIDARFGRAMAYVQLHRYQEARDHLVREMEAYPTVPAFAHALARLLAAAPDERVRDGWQAMGLIQPLLEQERTVDLGETLAMILAEVGDFEQAVAIQRELVAGAQSSGLVQLVGPLSANLALYENGQPCRTPWAPGAIP